MAGVKYLGCRELLWGENKKSTIGFVEITPESPVTSYISHHILLADVSGSMSGNIKTLKERIKTTLNTLLQIPDSYVSVITYSGHNESKRIISGIKCEETSYRMADIWNTIEEELYIKSVTVMSEPLEQSISIVKSLSNICNKHHIALFTDGCLVPTKWNEELEREKCFKVAEICNKEGIFLNAIGFGQYYDRAFLKELVEIAGNSSVIHIDHIKDYANIILNVIRKVNSEKLVSVDLSTSEGMIFHISDSIMKNSMRIRNFHEDGNLFAIINSINFEVDLREYQLDYKIELNDFEVLDEFYYSLARHYLLEEDTDNMEFAIKALGDLALFENIQNCYSFIEKGNAVNKITEVMENKSRRFLKGRNPIVETANEKLCILEILESIIEDSDSMLYWDINAPYHRITQHTRQIEDNIVFNRSGNVLLPVNSISIGSEKLNIGVKVRIDGEVYDNISKFRKEAHIYRDFNIINSGNINVQYINAKLSKALFEKFTSEGILENTGNLSYNPDNIYTIDLNGIKSTNKRVLKSMNISEIAENLYSIADLKCKQWALNQLIKEITSKKDRLSLLDMSQEEQETRRILRIDSNGIYSPAACVKDDNAPFEIYPAVFLTWDILKFPEKKRKEQYLGQLNECVTNMKFNSGKDEKDVYDYLMNELSHVRYDIRSREFKVNSVRIASAITNKSPFIWEETGEKTKTCTDKTLGRNTVVGGKLSYSKKTVGDRVIEQQKWVQLIKCN
jgi:hypothetical protein